MSLEGLLVEVNPPIFTQNFWGEKNAGFDVLSQNLKSACRSTSDFLDFLRESSAVDDTYCKALGKLAKQTSSYQTVGTFKPYWGVIRQLVEHISQLHASFAQDIQNLMKDVQKYLEEQQKQQKSIKDSEGSTQEVVHAFQATSLQMQKAKAVYHARFAEYQRLVRNESTSTREQEKIETKLKKAQNEYKYSVENYNNLRTQFVHKMRASCIQHQEIEVTHLGHMREFLIRFGSVWSAARDSLDRVCTKFTQDMGELTVDRLLDVFVKERGTGSSIPLEVTFEDMEVASLFTSTDKTAAMIADNVSSSSTGLGPAFRVSSALAVCDSEGKNNGLGSVASLTDASADSASVQSVPPPVNNNNGLGSAPSMLTKPAAATLGSKRGLFKRRRDSPHEPSPEGAGQLGARHSPNTVPQHRSSGSLSAFNLVARLGTRHLGSSTNGKEKLGRSSRALQPGTQEWQDNIPVEMPKDEEGYSIPPSDPWVSTVDDMRSESGLSSSDSADEVDVIGRSFKGLKVAIRPPGQLAPHVSAQIAASPPPPPPVVSASTTPLAPCHSQRALVPVLSDRRRSSGGGGGRVANSLKRATSIQPSSLGPASGHSLLARLPLAPALPPPPGTIMSTCPGGSDVDSGNSTTCLSPAQGRPTSRRRHAALRGSQSNADSSASHAAAFRTPVEPGSNPKPVDGPDQHSDGLACAPVAVSLTPVAGTMSSTDAVDKTQPQANWFAFGSESDGIVTTTSTQSTAGGSTSTLVNWATSPLPWSTSFSQSPAVLQPSPPARQSFRCAAANGFSTPHRAESVPVAAAFVETWQARFFNGGGSSFSTAATITPSPQQTVSGSLTLAFPTPAISLHLTAAGSSLGGPLILRLGNSSRLKHVRLQIPGSVLRDAQTDLPPAHTVIIPDSVLTEQLADRISQITPTTTATAANCINPSSASMTTVPYVSLTVLTYEVDLGPGPTHPSLAPPISLCTYWRCERDSTDFRLDYTTHWPVSDSPESPSSSHVPPSELHVAMPVDGHVTRMQSLPVGTWLADALQAVWKIPLSPASGSPSPQTGASPPNSSGTVRAKFLLDKGPGRPQPVTLRFVREDCLASGLRLTVESAEYRLSLCKRRLIGDQYVCEPPSQSSRFQLHRPVSPRPVDFNASSPQTPSHMPSVMLPENNSL